MAAHSFCGSVCGGLPIYGIALEMRILFHDMGANVFWNLTYQILYVKLIQLKYWGGVGTSE